MSWFGTEWHKIAIGIMVVDHGWRRVIEWEEDWKKSVALFGRRKEDQVGIIQIVELVPKLEKIVEDAEAAEQTPAGEALIADVKALIAEIKGMVPSAPTSKEIQK